MRRTVPFATVPFALFPTLVATTAVLLGGCDSNIAQRGFAATPGTIEKLEAGTQSREDVVRLIGSPSAVATFNPNIWYYISETQSYWAFTKPKITSQKVIQVTFSEAGRVDNIKNYDLQDGQDITMVARTTPTSGKELTVLEQILGNVGKFSGPKGQGTNPGAPTTGGGT